MFDASANLTPILQALLSGLLIGGLFALAAVGLSLVVGVLRIVNLVHGELVLLGAYAAYVLVQLTGMNPLWLAPLAGVAVAVLAWPLQHFLIQPIVKQREEVPLLTTFALSIIVQNLLVYFVGADTRSLDGGLSGSRVQLAGLTLPTVQLWCFAIAMVLCVGVHVLIAHTGLGRRMRASAEDSLAAGVVGVPVQRMYAITYCLAAAVAGVAGALLATVFSFTPASGVEYLLTGFAVVVLGGLGSIKGTVLGGLLLGVVESLGAWWLGDGYRLFIGLVVILLLLATHPQGLFGKRV
ncbi:MAG: branched-chain amino acid ABC transporter permease [Steroidobacteraceae bacterium]